MKFTTALLISALVLPVTGHARKMAYNHNNQMPDELVSFGTCSELELHVDKLLAAQNHWFRDARYGAKMMMKGMSANENVSMDMMAESAAAPSSAPPPPQDASRAMGIAGMAAKQEAKPKKTTGTNNQVESVDEADFVKFNGKHIYQLYNGTLRILNAWPANEMNQVASLQVTGQPQEMLINERNAVVMASDGQNLTATVIDISNPHNPRPLTSFEIPGQYKTARLIGDTLRIVNQDYNSIHTYWRHMPIANSNGWLQEETTDRKLNIQPTTQVLNGNRKTIDVVEDCKNVLVPKSAAPNVLTRLISIDLKAKKYDETLAFVQPDTVYASEKAIYLAHTGYGMHKDMSIQQTAIHKFSLAHGKTAEYQASGIINGHLINQFAMDEHKDNLRAATNGSEYSSQGWFGRDQVWQQISRVQVLAQKGKALKTIGKTGDMAKGERLYSVRFNGDKGFVVTFRNVDPLFTLDLSNPYNPRVIGELKVPGFSTYIHMLDANHLLTVGQDADEQTGRPRGLKLSVFDVRNFAKPKEVKSLIFKSDVSSESSYEHKAFTFYREKGILAIPATQGYQRHSLLFFSVTTTNIKPASELNMTDLAGVRRSFFADDVVYAIGGNGVRAAMIASPQNPLATVSFDQSLAEAGW